MFEGTNWSQVSDINGLMYAANAPANGFFWTGMLYMIWVTLLIIFISPFGFETALLTSSFIAMTIGMALVYGGLVSFSWGILTFIGTILATIIYINWATRSDSWG